MVAFLIAALAAAWLVHGKNERAQFAKSNSANEPCLNRKQDPNLIIENCTKLIDAGASSSKTLAYLHVHRGYALDRLDKWTEAIVDFDRAIELNPKDFQAWQGKSFALDGLDEDLAALEAVEQSLALAPTQRYSANRKFRLLAKLKRYQEADAYYSELMAMYPSTDDPRRYWMPQELGKMRLALGQTEAAAEVLTIAVLSKPSEQRSRQLFFRACIELGPDCPRLLPASDASSAELDCNAVSNQVASQFPKFWAGLHPDATENDATLEALANKARMQIIEAAYVTYAVGLQLGEEGTAGENFLLFDGLVSCVETGEIFNPIETAGLSEETKKFHGGMIRRNMVDLARYMKSKAD